LIEKDFYKDFIIGGDVKTYVDSRMKSGVWGDHIELQALKNLFNIPIEIYSYSS